MKLIDIVDLKLEGSDVVICNKLRLPSKLLKNILDKKINLKHTITTSEETTVISVNMLQINDSFICPIDLMSAFLNQNLGSFDHAKVGSINFRSYDDFMQELPGVPNKLEKEYDETTSSAVSLKLEEIDIYESIDVPKNNKNESKSSGKTPLKTSY